MSCEDIDQSPAAAINETVELHAPDPAWARAFVLERDRLDALLPGAFQAIEHIASTAVPDMVAKPIIDIMAGVASLDGVDALIDGLRASGYTTSRQFNATLVDREWLMRCQDGHRTHHSHIVVHGARRWNDPLQFRDALQHGPTLARRYANLKAAVAAEYRSNREAHTQAKTEFILTVVRG